MRKSLFILSVVTGLCFTTLAQASDLAPQNPNCQTVFRHLPHLLSRSFITVSLLAADLGLSEAAMLGPTDPQGSEKMLIQIKDPRPGTPGFDDPIVIGAEKVAKREVSNKVGYYEVQVNPQVKVTAGKKGIECYGCAGQAERMEIKEYVEIDNAIYSIRYADVRGVAGPYVIFDRGLGYLHPGRKYYVLHTPTAKLYTFGKDFRIDKIKSKHKMKIELDQSDRLLITLTNKEGDLSYEIDPQND